MSSIGRIVKTANVGMSRMANPRAAQAVRTELLNIIRSEPRGEYVTWGRLRSYLGDVCSVATLMKFTNGDLTDRATKDLVAQLDQAVRDFLSQAK